MGRFHIGYLLLLAGEKQEEGSGFERSKERDKEDRVRMHPRRRCRQSVSIVIHMDRRRRSVVASQIRPKLKQNEVSMTSCENESLASKGIQSDLQVRAQLHRHCSGSRNIEKNLHEKNCRVYSGFGFCL